MDLALVVQVRQAEEEFPANDGDLTFVENPGFKLRCQLSILPGNSTTDQVKTAPSGQILHDNPKPVPADKATIVPRDMVRETGGKVGYLRLDFGDVVVAALEVCSVS